MIACLACWVGGFGGGGVEVGVIPQANLLHLDWTSSKHTIAHSPNELHTLLSLLSRTFGCRNIKRPAFNFWVQHRATCLD